MEAMFTEEEKRFVLAEMIKTSRLDLDALTLFIKANQVEPDWMHMQLPSGRNMHQCVQFVEGVAIQSSISLKRKLSNDQDDHTIKRQVLMDRPELHASFASHTSPQMIHQGLTSPSMLQLASPGKGMPPNAASTPSPATEGPKKRGRPSRQDKQKRDSYRPLLPQPTMPRLPQLKPPFVPGRPLLPALARKAETINVRPMTPPDLYIADGKPLRHLQKDSLEVSTSPKEEEEAASRYNSDKGREQTPPMARPESTVE